MQEGSESQKTEKPGIPQELNMPNDVSFKKELSNWKSITEKDYEKI